MNDLHPGFVSAIWPRPADNAAVTREFERWQALAEAQEDKAAADFVRALPQTTVGAGLLPALFGNSPYLTQCLFHEIPFAMNVLRQGPDRAVAALIRAMRQDLGGPQETASLMTALRVAKRRSALVTALADIGGLWTVEQVTAALSDFAETALSLAVRHLLREAADNGTLRLTDRDEPEKGSGFAVIGMGKLGGRELNYSSDIDLIVLYDDELNTVVQPEALQKIFIRLTRAMVRIMEEPTADGYVLRTDLRLRPDPAATPLAISVTAAETYYESLGQNWERAAMIKARPVAGDRKTGAEFLNRLKPYVWRKHLDFAAIADIHSIKRQIHAHRGGGEVALGGHNIKIGRGGIREIEFFVQTQQLIWGGRVPLLRQPATCDALEALVEVGRVKREVADDLNRVYHLLRRVEHRLQMIDDHQTHTLPPEGPKMEAFAIFMGFASAAGFGQHMLAEFRCVERHYAKLFEDSPTLSAPGNLVFTGTDDDPNTLETLSQMGFKDAKLVSAAIRGWHHGRYRAMRSVRARELLTELKPRLLQSFIKTAQPDAAFIKFDHFLSRLPAGVQLFSLFHANPFLLDFVAEIMGGAPRLAEILGRQPQLLDSVLSSGFFERIPPREELAADLARALEQAQDHQDVLDICRRWKHEREFQVGVRALRAGGADRAIDPDEIGGALTDIAECVLDILQARVEREFARAHGTLPGGNAVTVALGKLGGREMTVTSDLDLMFIYDVPSGVDASDGAKPLPPSLYYTRFSTRFINDITALTPEGRLYEVDMRLRPSGSKGPIATNLDGFLAYNRKSAWTWEHMALTRARVIVGEPALRQRVADTIREVLIAKRDPDKLVADIASMRALMAREHAARSQWDIKQMRGGLIDVEFIAQFLQLRHAATTPEILSPNTRAALRKAAELGLIDAADGEMLLGALGLWQTVQAIQRLTVEGEFKPDELPIGLRELLARSAGAADFGALEATIVATAERVRAIFDRLLPLPETAEPAPAAGTT